VPKIQLISSLVKRALCLVKRQQTKKRNKMPNSIQDHLINIILVSIGYIVSMILVQSVIVPAQQQYLPAITTFAALIFPLHGVRVISAWLFGAWSILYLFIANIIMYFVLTPDADFTVKSFYAWTLVSTVAWFTFEAFRLTGINLYQSMSSISNYTWRRLMLVAFVSSIINSLGHNVIFAGDIIPENSLPTMFAFMVGDTLGTLVCFLVLLICFRSMRLLRN
jgi:hypothetical protein